MGGGGQVSEIMLVSFFVLFCSVLFFVLVYNTEDIAFL